jgi:purine-binding chemotaxis protein CheW
MSEIAPFQASARTFYTFRLQNRLYGIDVAQIREVSTHAAVTLIPQAPPIVRGLANLRSRIYLVLDVGPALGLSPSAGTDAGRLIVLKPSVAEDLGFLVESGGDIVPVPPEEIEEAAPRSTDPAESSTDRLPSPVIGVCKLDAELMMIIDPLRIVEVMENAIS